LKELDMSDSSRIDGVLVQWGERLFYPGNRIVKDSPQPRLRGNARQHGAAAIRERIEATVLRRAIQVMVKVTGGGRGMSAIVAHLRYISKNGRLDIEDEHGQTSRGKDALHELAVDWRYGGTLIDEVSDRRDAFNIMLSMQRGSADSLTVLRAAREFAQTELADHKYVMVLHDHQANPHVHISVRAESKHGKRLNPRKTDLHRWRETFAEKLRGWGFDAEASRQATRGVNRRPDALWRIKAAEDGRLRRTPLSSRSACSNTTSRKQAIEAWSQLSKRLAMSGDSRDQELAGSIDAFLRQLHSTATSTVKRMDVTHTVEGGATPVVVDRQR
jgi:hypothetical protein